MTGTRRSRPGRTRREAAAVMDGSGEQLGGGGEAGGGGRGRVEGPRGPRRLWARAGAGWGARIHPAGRIRTPRADIRVRAPGQARACLAPLPAGGLGWAGSHRRPSAGRLLALVPWLRLRRSRSAGRVPPPVHQKQSPGLACYLSLLGYPALSPLGIMSLPSPLTSRDLGVQAPLSSSLHQGPPALSRS